jgi:hypothetical protein
MGNKIKRCPFRDGKCLQDGCTLWGQVNTVRPGPLGGPGKPQQVEGCIFNLLVLLTASPRPVVVVNPRPGIHPPS